MILWNLWFIWGFPGSSAGKESTCNAGDPGSIPGLGRCPGEGKGYPLQYSDLENSMDYIVHGVAKSQTQLSDFHFIWFIWLLWPRNNLHRQISGQFSFPLFDNFLISYTMPGTFIFLSSLHELTLADRYSYLYSVIRSENWSLQGLCIYSGSYSLQTGTRSQISFLDHVFIIASLSTFSAALPGCVMENRS